MYLVLKIPKSFFRFNEKFESKISNEEITCIFDLEDKIDRNAHIKNVYTYVIYFVISNFIIEKFDYSRDKDNKDLHTSAFNYLKLFLDNNYNFTKTIEEIDYALHDSYLRENFNIKHTFDTFKNYCLKIKIEQIFKVKDRLSNDIIEDFMNRLDINELLFVNFLSNNVKFYNFD
jgi:hypothetical protein